MPKLTSLIDTLPEEDRERIITWLETHSTKAVVELIASPPPEGYGLKTHATTLRRFYARHQRDSRSSELEIAELLNFSESDIGLENATSSLLKFWAFRIASNPRRTNGSFKAIARWSLKCREQIQKQAQIEINRERLNLEREKFYFDAAKQALAHRKKLREILDDEGLQDAEKIRAARIFLFGESLASDEAAPHHESKTE